MILVLQHAYHDMCLSDTRDFPHVFNQRRDGLAVMGNVQDAGDLTGDDLEPAGKPKIPQAGLDRFPADRKFIGHGLQNHQHAGGIFHLPVIVDTGLGQPLVNFSGIVPVPGVLADRIAEFPAGLVQQRACFPGTGRYGCRRPCVRAYRRTSAPENPGFLPAYALPGITQPLLVVQVDRHHQGDIRIEDVDGVQPAAQPHLQDNDVRLSVAEYIQGSQCAEFEIGQGNVGARPVDTVK